MCFSDDIMDYATIEEQKYLEVISEASMKYLESITAFQKDEI